MIETFRRSAYQFGDLIQFPGRAPNSVRCAIMRQKQNDRDQLDADVSFADALGFFASAKVLKAAPREANDLVLAILASFIV